MNGPGVRAGAVPLSGAARACCPPFGHGSLSGHGSWGLGEAGGDVRRGLRRSAAGGLPRGRTV
ncbi:hypothetical protein ACFV0L_13930 [Streptosporangium canum]|uniref:hypothetical protein n=1 Tax=Streptosporangium canum TaxID=324952 RepID=UPI00369A7611